MTHVPTNSTGNALKHVSTCCACPPTVWPPPWLAGGESAPPEATEPEPPTDSTPVETPEPQSVPELSAADVYGHWWDEITDADRHYLTGLRNWPEPCAWCGGRATHNRLCVVLTWEPTLPFGKHKGKRVSEVPSDYLLWLLNNSTSLEADLMAVIKESLLKRRRAN